MNIKSMFTLSWARGSLAVALLALLAVTLPTSTIHAAATAPVPVSADVGPITTAINALFNPVYTGKMPAVSAQLKGSSLYINDDYGSLTNYALAVQLALYCKNSEVAADDTTNPYRFSCGALHGLLYPELVRGTKNEFKFKSLKDPADPKYLKGVAAADGQSGALSLVTDANQASIFILSSWAATQAANEGGSRGGGASAAAPASSSSGTAVLAVQALPKATIDAIDELFVLSTAVDFAFSNTKKSAWNNGPKALTITAAMRTVIWGTPPGDNKITVALNQLKTTGSGLNTQLADAIISLEKLIAKIEIQKTNGSMSYANAAGFQSQLGAFVENANAAAAAVAAAFAAQGAVSGGAAMAVSQILAAKARAAAALTVAIAAVPDDYEDDVIEAINAVNTNQENLRKKTTTVAKALEELTRITITYINPMVGDKQLMQNIIALATAEVNLYTAQSAVPTGTTAVVNAAVQQQSSNAIAAADAAVQASRAPAPVLSVAAVTDRIQKLLTQMVAGLVGRKMSNGADVAVISAAATAFNNFLKNIPDITALNAAYLAFLGGAQGQKVAATVADKGDAETILKNSADIGNWCTGIIKNYQLLVAAVTAAASAAPAPAPSTSSSAAPAAPSAPMGPATQRDTVLAAIQAITDQLNAAVTANQPWGNGMVGTAAISTIISGSKITDQLNGWCQVLWNQAASAVPTASAMLAAVNAFNTKVAQNQGNAIASLDDAIAVRDALNAFNTAAQAKAPAPAAKTIEQRLKVKRFWTELKSTVKTIAAISTANAVSLKAQFNTPKLASTNLPISIPLPGGGIMKALVPPLQVAIVLESPGAVAHLLQAGADVNAPSIDLTTGKLSKEPLINELARNPATNKLLRFIPVAKPVVPAKGDPRGTAPAA